MRRLIAFRFAALALVNAIIVYHLYAYYVRGHTAVGCVDFYGLTTALARGEVTAGTLFIAGLFAITLILGRVFCGWGCHFALFQDVTARVAEKLGLKLPFRESVLQWIVPPMLVAMTMGLPILRYWGEHGMPHRVTTRLAYPELWHLLPGWKGVLLMLAVDAVVLTLVFGKRAFCRYVCPYGLLLKIVHLASPTRIVPHNACDDCGRCASACPTGVPIQFEIKEYSVIHDLNCMNCGDCVAACPSGALALRPTRTAYARSFATSLRAARQPLWTECLLLGVVIAGWWLYRGRDFGDFLAVGMGLVAGALVVGAVSPERLFRRRWLARSPRRRRRVRTILAVVGCYLLLGMVGQGVARATLSGALRSADAGRSHRAFVAIRLGASANVFFRPFTFYLDDFSARSAPVADAIYERANHDLEAGRWSQAEALYRAVLAAEPNRAQASGNLGTCLYEQGRFWAAAQCYLRVLDTDPNDMIALYHLAMTRTRLGQTDEAVDLIRQILFADAQGSMYPLIDRNSELAPLQRSPAYRRLLAVYRRTHPHLSPEEGKP